MLQKSASLTSLFAKKFVASSLRTFPFPLPLAAHITTMSSVRPPNTDMWAIENFTNSLARASNNRDKLCRRIRDGLKHPHLYETSLDAATNLIQTQSPDPQFFHHHFFTMVVQSAITPIGRLAFFRYKPRLQQFLAQFDQTPLMYHFSPKQRQRILDTIQDLKNKTKPDKHEDFLTEQAAQDEKNAEIFIPAAQRPLPLECPAEKPSQVPEEPPVRLRRAEYILAHRTTRLILVVERCLDRLNQHAILRTAEAMGVHHVWMVMAAESRGMARGVTRGTDRWLNVRKFVTSEDCVEALKDEGYEIWATDLEKDAMRVPGSVEEAGRVGFCLPEGKKVALVMGQESTGITQVMREASHRRIFLPMFGMADSYNVSVASALMLQAMFFLFPQLRGAATEQDRAEIRRDWYQKLIHSEESWFYSSWYLFHPPPPVDDPRRESRGINVVSKMALRQQYAEAEQRRLAEEAKEKQNAP